MTPCWVPPRRDIRTENIEEPQKKLRLHHPELVYTQNREIIIEVETSPTFSKHATPFRLVSADPITTRVTCCYYSASSFKSSIFRAAYEGITVLSSRCGRRRPRIAGKETLLYICSFFTQTHSTYHSKFSPFRISHSNLMSVGRCPDSRTRTVDLTDYVKRVHISTTTSQAYHTAY